MRYSEDSLNYLISTQVSETLKSLLSNKHLYQNEKVDQSIIKKQILNDFGTIRPELPPPANSGSLFINPSKPTSERKEDYLKKSLKVILTRWNPMVQGFDIETETSPRPDSDWIFFELPVPKIFCEKCNEKYPFTPVIELSSYKTSVKSGSIQHYFLAYKCNYCDSDPVRFLIKRDSMKLTLAGRDPIEQVQIPSYIPKSISKYYSDSVLAYQSGQTLAGIFLLRVMIEQHWKSQPEVDKFLQTNPKYSGEEIGKVYKSTLSKDFLQRFPSLSDAYSTISERIHTANPDTECYEKVRTEVLLHFEAIQLFSKSKQIL